MKKILTLFSGLLIAAMATAQDLEKIAELSCECIGKKDFSSIPKEQVEMTLGLCILEASKTSGFEFDATNIDQSRQFGEKVGMSMVTKCPEVFTKLTQYMTDDEEEQEGEELLESSGKIKSVEVSDFVTVIVKESSGKEVKYLWLRYFSGSDDYVKDPKKLVGKDATITYREIECFMPKAGGYFKQKEIASIEFK